MFIIVIILGIVEGLTEFLPVSSTGHLILVGHLLDFTGPTAGTFEVVIQFGAILAVVWEYRASLWSHARTVTSDVESRRYYGNIVVAFIPAAILGFLFHDFLKEHLFHPRNVAWALIVGAVIIQVVEMLKIQPRTETVEKMSVRQAFGIGVAQCAALFPGFSRSAATILGGLLAGCSRPTAASFSFLLAIPTILGATVLDLAKAWDTLRPEDLGWIGLGLVISFLSAWAAVRWFLRYVSHHSLSVFAAYRLVIGIVVLLVLG